MVTDNFSETVTSYRFKRNHKQRRINIEGKILRNITVKAAKTSRKRKILKTDYLSHPLPHTQGFPLVVQKVKETA